MTNNLIVLLLLIGMNCSLFAQGEKKISSELELVIYKGNAYKKWYRFNVNSGRKIRELEERRLNNKVSQNVLDIIKEKTDKANKKEAKAKVFHAVNLPITFIFHKNESIELPWKAASVEFKNNEIYEDDFLKIEISNIQISNTSTQNIFNFSALVTNKHVLYPNLSNKLVHGRFNIHYRFEVIYSDGKRSSLHSNWSGSIYRAQSPRIYKTDNKTYSFIPFLDRFEEAIRAEALKTFK